ncbi:MAG: 5'-nucleotidase C-terminal domain-containing protein [Bacteroidetes bacterium]|nr:5'-nucleotidase C-terminal domain-containing protein [Bacteroidota bacterium]
MRNISYLLCLLAVVACRSSKVSLMPRIEAGTMALKADLETPADTGFTNLIAPYKIEIDKQFGEVIGTCSTPLTKSTPEGNLGNFATDACMQYVASLNKYGRVDFCFLNNGGLRKSIAVGDIKIYDMFELMPFDNEITIVEITGSTLLKLADFIAAKDGMPVSGIQLTIKDQKAVSITINQSPIDTSRTYTLMTSDFLANGGDKLTVLANPVNRINTGIYIRDILINYIKSLTNQNKTVEAKLEGRITNVK